MRICIVDEANHTFYTGDTWAEILLQVATIRFENTQLFLKFKGYEEQRFHSYNKEEFTEQEMKADAIRFASGKLRLAGYDTYTGGH